MTKQDTTHTPEHGSCKDNSTTHPSSRRSADRESLNELIPGTLIGMAVGMLITVLLWWLFADSIEALHGSQEQKSDERQPLYWVAPMDDSYRRDKPGKSPMGMDLVPVYDDSAMSGMQHGNRMSAGTIMIAPNVQQNIGVKTQKVHIGYLDSAIRVTGNVTYNEDTIVHIHPRVEGWVERLFIKSQGEEVQQGQALYTLYSPELVSAQEEFLLALKRDDKPLLAGARARLGALALSDSFVDSLQRTKKVSQTVTFYAPQSGVVEALTIREGFFVKPGTTIMSIAKLDSVWVIADVPETFAQRVNVHDSVKIRLGFAQGQVWQSHIDYIYPSLDAVTRTLKARVLVNNSSARLKPNMFANVQITSREERPSLLVPKSAVIRTATSTRVVIADNTGHFKSVAVALGNADEHFFEVTDGLLPDDTVVISAQFLIDSESSKDSDFMRMSEPDNQATTTGKVVALPENLQRDSSDHQSLNAVQKNKITIARGPIEKWERGPATMEFMLSPHIDASSLSVGDNIVFTFVTGDDFTVVHLKSATKTSASSHSHNSHAHNVQSPIDHRQNREIQSPHELHDAHNNHHTHENYQVPDDKENREPMEHMNHD